MWTCCFSLYMAMLSKKAAEMVPSMVAHLHTVLVLQQKASSQLARLEYASSSDGAGSISQPGLDMWRSEAVHLMLARLNLSWRSFLKFQRRTPIFPAVGGGKRREAHGTRRREGVAQAKLPAKKPKKTGVCRLFNSAPGGCPYRRECIFVHHCNNCGAVNKHHHLVCPFPQIPTRD